MAGSFAKLVEESHVSEVTIAFEAAILKSFDADAVKTRLTGAEVKHRFDLCAKIFESLVGDCKWTVTRAISYLPRYLRCELDGIPWTPDTRSCWIPGETA